MNEIMTTREVAAYLRLHEVTICKHAKNGTIPCIHVGRVLRFRRDAIDAWLMGASTIQMKRADENDL